MVSNSAIGAETQVSLLGPQDYQMWLAHSDWYPHAYSAYFPDHPWHKRMWRTAVRTVPGSTSPQTKEMLLLAGLGGVAIIGILVALSLGKKGGVIAPGSF